MSASTYASDFAITVSLTADTITVTTSRLYHLDEVDEDGNVVAYIGCVQTRSAARAKARREATARQVPRSRIVFSRGAR